MTTATSLDEEEVNRFNALADTWWDASGPMWPLHRLNRIRVPFILDEIVRHGIGGECPTTPLQGIRVLDVGCGAGLLSESMAVLGARVTGIDPAEKNIAMARKHAMLSGLQIDYLHGGIECLGERQFDVVLNMEVVEHVQHLEPFMARCCEATKPGGLHFLATINRNPLSWLVAIVGAEYILRWLPRGTHQWQKFVKPSEAKKLLADGGLDVISTVGVSINPFNRAYRLTEFTGVNYMMAARSKN